MIEKPQEKVSEMDAAVVKILGQVDRKKFFEQTGNRYVRHPLLKDRLGEEIPTNVALHDMLTQMALAQSFGPDSRAQEQARRNQVELLECAVDVASMAAAIVEMQDILAKDNPAGRLAALGHLENTLRRVLPLPEPAQSLIVYSVVMDDVLVRRGPAALMEKVAQIRADLASSFSPNPEAHAKFIAEVDAEVKFVNEWLTRMGTQPKGGVLPENESH